jgi:hypothetical protein
VKRLGTLMPDLPGGLVAVIEKAMHPNRDERFGSADEFRLALAPFAGALSREGELARARPPVERPRSLVEAPAKAASRVPQPAVSTSFGVADTLDGPPASRVPKTLPPEDGAPAARGTEIAAPVPVPERVVGAPRVARRRKRRTGLWVALLALTSLALGAAIVVILSLPRQITVEIPALPPVELGGAPGAIVIDPGATEPTGGSGATMPGSPPAPIPPRPQGVPNPRQPNTPLPFPSFALPSALPPLPSGFPTALPSGFPPILPSALPQIPGLPFPFPGTPAPPASTGAP